MPITMTVDGRVCTREVEPRLLLARFLRETLGLTGTKVECDTSQCGACTVLENGSATKSCTRLAVQAERSSITTDVLAKAASAAAHRLNGDVLGDIFASAEYRKAMAPVHVKRALAAAVQRAS